MRVTLLADASFCPNTRIAGYGFWIAAARGKLPGHGVFKTLCRDNVVAEMRAIVYAMRAGMQHGVIQKHDELLIQVDCLAAISAFDGSRTELNEEEKAVHRYFKDLKRQGSFEIEWRHVKGHSSTTDARSLSNNSCDRRARREMRKARDAFLLKENEDAKQAHPDASA